LRWELDNKHYHLKRALGNKTWFGFGPPTNTRPSQWWGEAYVEVIDNQTGKAILLLDPWTPPGPWPFDDYHAIGPWGRSVWKAPPDYTPDRDIK